MDVIDKWLSIALYEPTIDYKRRLLKRANDAVKMLSESKLWGNIKNEIEDFLKLPNDKIEEFVKAATSDFYENVWKDHYNTNENKKFPWLQTPNVFESFLQDRCWKSVHFSYNNDYEISRIKENIKNKKNYRTRWRENYYNSLEVKFNCKDNIARGWYSEEYKGCVNGYYYFLFDANHAIFIEKD